ncbi:MAG TPA: MFS transporter [Burkholderiales bacterium]|nr:MFS transporter [Burkholderiales bacterium]
MEHSLGQARDSKRFFYGWYMVGAGASLQFLLAGLMTQSFGAYVAVLQAERGWSKTALSGAAALQQMEAAILGPLLGWLIDRFGPQGIIRFGIVVFGCGLMLLSQTDSLLAFYGAFLVIAVGASCCGLFPINVALIHWFERWRARALSSMSIGLALGGISVPAIAWSLSTYGWRVTAFASGVIAIVVGLPLAMIIRRRPEDHGDTVDGLPPVTPAAGNTAGALDPRRDFTAGEALRTSAFWLLSLGHGFALFVVHAVSVHSITHMKQDLGYTLEQASFVYTLLTLSQIGGVCIGWLIGDRYEKRLIAAACMLMHMSGLLLLTYAFNAAMVLAFAVLHGAAWGLRGPFMQALRADYFGRSAIGMILGLSLMIVVVGQVGGPMIAGVLADLTGNYRAGFTILALLAGLGSLFFVLARKPERPLK